MAEEDNINRSIKVRGGIYTARAKEGRYAAKHAPYGYIKVGEKRNQSLVVDKEKAEVVRVIYDAYLHGMPFFEIRKVVKGMGFDTKGNSAVQKVLSNPVYAGLLGVKPFKDFPGGYFTGNHEPIIDIANWHLVQSKLKKPEKLKVQLDERFPLRGVLKCHCGQLLTGAPSRGKSGQYYNYYKCQHSKHNNVNADKAHDQFLEVCKLMSIPEAKIQLIQANSEKELELSLKSNKSRAEQKQQELDGVQTKLMRVEEKWISNEVNRDTYERWYRQYTNEASTLTSEIRKLKTNHQHAFQKLSGHLDKLSDMHYIYSKCCMEDKQSFIKLVFDNNLYYENGIYRTPTMMQMFAHNSLKMKEKGLHIYKKIGGNRNDFP
ncbi:recombinase family protein [Leadbetterella byssophila]|uniref:recombinase family protein n=1 Tax=Leadbetterella byssophila TaxID=316068 RepID=UPI0039A00353